MLCLCFKYLTNSKFYSTFLPTLNSTSKCNSKFHFQLDLENSDSVTGFIQPDISMPICLIYISSSCKGRWKAPTFLYQVFSKCRTQTHSISITWEHVRNSEFQVPLRLVVPEVVGRDQQVVFYQLPS